MTIILRRPQTRQPICIERVNGRAQLAKGLIFAGLPTAYGMIDASQHRANFALGYGAVIPATPGLANGLFTPFTTSSAYSFSGVAAPSASGFSAAVWVKTTTQFQTEYGTILSRAGTSGATDAGGDWEILWNGSNRVLTYARDGAILFSSNFTQTIGAWYLLQLSIANSGAATWWASGDGNVASVTNSSSGVGVRTAPGDVGINGYVFNWTGRGSAHIGRVYMWNRATTQQEAAQLYLNEWSLFDRSIIIPVGAAAPTTFVPSWARQNSRVIGGGV